MKLKGIDKGPHKRWGMWWDQKFFHKIIHPLPVYWFCNLKYRVLSPLQLWNIISVSANEQGSFWTFATSQPMQNPFFGPTVGDCIKNNCNLKDETVREWIGELLFVYYFWKNCNEIVLRKSKFSCNVFNISLVQAKKIQEASTSNRVMAKRSIPH